METTSVLLHISHIATMDQISKPTDFVLFPKFFPKRSVHKTVYCIPFTLSKYKDNPNQVSVMNAIMAIECGNLITVPHQGSCVSLVI
jgi:hypothetical protein